MKDMNKHFIELAEKAGFMIWADEDWNPGDVIDWSARYDKELELYSKMLIEQCMQIADRTFFNSNGLTPSLEIKNHFGI